MKLLKWYYFFYFLITSGFSSERALKNAIQTTRQFEWENRIADIDACFCDDKNDDCECTECTCKEE